MYGYPHMVGHRSSLAGSLFAACKREKSIIFHFSTAAAGVESWTLKPILKVKPRDGEAYHVETDILLAADGLKSCIRDQMLKELNINA
jgi:salicylate hydroxylase